MNDVEATAGVDDLLENESLVISPGMSALKDEDLAKFVAKVINEVAPQYAVKPADVYQARNVKSGSNLGRARTQCMRRLYNAGMTNAQIGEVWRVSGNQVGILRASSSVQHEEVK